MDLLTAHRAELDQLVALLLSNETVDGSEVYAIAGRREPAGGAGMMLAPERAAASATEHPARPTKHKGSTAPAKAKTPGEARRTTRPSG